MADRSLTFKFLGDARDLDSASRKAQRSLGDTENKAGKAERAFGGLNRTLVGFAGAIGAAEIGRFAIDAAQMAQAADRAAISAEKVLGPALQGLRDNLDESRQAMGLNTLELDQIIAQYGLLSEEYFTTDEAQAEFLEGLITLGGDLAAFKGDLSAAPQAVDAFGAALRGEFDPLEQFGVKLKESEIAQRALEIQAEDTSGTITDQEARVQALTELINEKAAPAIGSLDEAMADGATSANELNTKIEDMKIKLGQKLAPALEFVLGFMLDVFDSWENLTTDFDNTRLGHVVKELEPVGRVLKWILDNLLNIPAAFKTVKDIWNGAKNTWNSITGFLGNVAGKIGLIPGHAAGGIVTGPKGAPKLIVAHGGERVVNDDMPGNGGGGGDTHIYVTAGIGDPQAIARSIVDVLQVYNRTNGAVPITVRNSE